MATIDMDYMKKGGKVKGSRYESQPFGKAKGKSKAIATATNTVHVHVNKRQSAPRKVMRTLGGNMVMERQLGQLFQQLGQMSYHPPLYASYPPLKEQSSVVLPPEKELPQQQSNIINLADLAREPIIEDLYRGRFVREEWDRQEQFSHASHLPSSVDHGDPAEVRSLPFSRVSYGDEQNQEVCEIDTNGKGQMSGGYYGDYEDFVSHPAEPMLKEAPIIPIEQPMSQPVGLIQPHFPPLERRLLRPTGYIFGEHGLGYTKEGKSRTKPIRNDEYSEYSAGFTATGMNPSRPGRQYHIRPFMESHSKVH
jgi:hypothetical protein